jgi:hypothetical protein
LTTGDVTDDVRVGAAIAAPIAFGVRQQPFTAIFGK